ncbi:MAG: hypothetical protein ACREGL_11305, partial [Alphaproteobacteria bacterium]
GIDRLARSGDHARDRVARTLSDHGLDFVMAGDGPIFQAYYTKGPIRDHRDVRASDLAFNSRVHRHMYAAGIYMLPSKSYLCLQHDDSHVEHYCDVLSWALAKVKSGGAAT